MYLLIYCLKGSLPWSGHLNLEFLNNPKATQMIYQWRDPDGPLCADIDNEIKQMLIYALSMDFAERP